MMDYVYKKKSRSVSQINQYEKCPMSYKLARIDREWRKPAAWLYQGTAVHAVAERYMLRKLGYEDVLGYDAELGYAGTGPMTREEAYELFEQEYSDAVDEATDITPNLDWWFRSGPYRGEADLERRWDIGMEQVDKLIDWIETHDEEKIWVAPDGTPGIEIKIDVEIGGVQIIGYIDAVIEVDGEIRIRDYKGLDLDTQLATPTGWTTMRDVKVGDEVFALDGVPTKVTVKSGTKRIGTYVVKFDDGSQVICDTEHIWWTQRGNEPASAKGIDEVIRTLRGKNGQAHHRVPVAYALDLPEVDLELSPYVLGAWLGDGKHTSGEITKDQLLFDQIKAAGCSLGKPWVDPRSGVITHTVRGIRGPLIELGLMRNKHIPPHYLRAGYKQRLALLQGLMDTDGSWNIARKTAVFSSTHRRLADGAMELLYGLGQRPHLSHVCSKGFGKEVDTYVVEFNPVDIIPFRHERKLEAMFSTGFKNNTKSTRRLIMSVEPGPDVETACIGVDHPSHTYLCGKEMIPTHNTGNEPGDDFQLAVYAVALKKLYDVDIEVGEYWMAGKKGKKAFATHPFDLTDWPEEKVAARFQALEAKLEAGEFEPKPSADACGFCDVALACPFSMA